MSEPPLNFRRRQNDKLAPMPHPHDETEKCPGGCDDIQIIEDAVCKYRREISEIDSRITQTHDQITRLETRQEESTERMGRMEATLSANASKIDKNTAETSEILQIMRDGESFFRFARRAGEVLKWTLGIATAIAAFWVALKGLPK